MPETVTPDKIKEVQFISLIMMIEESAMYGLGKLANPMTKKVERNLVQARTAIDMLEMLSAKTKGNLNDHEKRFIENTLTQLRLNFVEESEEDKKNSTNKENISEGSTNEKE